MLKAGLLTVPGPGQSTSSEAFLSEMVLSSLEAGFHGQKEGSGLLLFLSYF